MAESGEPADPADRRQRADQADRRRAYLAALLRVDECLVRAPEEVLPVLVDEVLRITGGELAMFTTMEAVAGELRQRVEYVSRREDSAVAISPGNHWPWVQSACAEMLASGTQYLRDFQVDRPGHRWAELLNLRGFLSIPVMDPSGTQVVAGVCAADSQPMELDDEVLAVVRMLTTAATAPLLGSISREEGRRTALRVDASALGMLELVRRAQDEIGNSMGVAVGRIRLAADAHDAGYDRGDRQQHLDAALKRLERLTTSLATTFWEMREAAVTGAVLTPVELTAAVAGAGRGPTLRAPYGQEVWALAQEHRLLRVIQEVGGSLTGEVVCRDGLVILPVTSGAALTTTSLLDLEASGGRVTQHGRLPALGWAATTGIVRT